MLLETLSNARGVSGNEDEVRTILTDAVRDRVDECRVDSLGNLITVKRARAGRQKSPPKVMLAAHMDEVGLMIVHIESTGFLRFRPVGGIDPRVLLSKVVLVGKDKVPGVIGVKPVHLLKPEERAEVADIESMYIDIGAKSKEDAAASVRIGDYATFAVQFGEMGERLVKGKALDDRTGCAVLVDLLRRDYPCDVYGVFTVQEEVGSRGARVAAHALAPDLAFAIESTVCDDSPKTKDLSPTTRLGGGVAITVADNTLLSDSRLVRLLIATAQENRIPYQVKQPMKGGTDAGRISLVKEGIPAVAVAVPTRYIHSPVSLLSLADYDNTVALMTRTLGKMTDGWQNL